MEGQGVTADPQLQHFIEIESQKQRFQQLVHQMTEVCWVSEVGSVGLAITQLTLAYPFVAINLVVDTRAWETEDG